MTKKDNNNLLLFGAIGIAAYFILKPKKATTTLATAVQRTTPQYLLPAAPASNNIINPDNINNLVSIVKDIFGSGTNSYSGNDTTTDSGMIYNKDYIYNNDYYDGYPQYMSGCVNPLMAGMAIEELENM